MKELLALCIAASACGAISAGAAEFDFDAYQSRQTGSWADSVAAGDINGDGREDVVLATSDYSDAANDYHVFVYLQQNDGTLASPVKYKYAQYTSRSDVEIADIDNDGIGDVLVGHSGGVTVLKGASHGGLTASFITTDLACEHIATTDIDMDGNQDVVCQSWANGAKLLYGNGTGGIRNQTTLATGGNGYNDIKLGDITGDGRPDLVITSAQSSSVFVYPHLGNGFGVGLAYPAPESSWTPSANAIGDFNSDGRNDLAVAVGGNRPNSGVWLYPQQASGRLGTPVRMSSHDIPESLVAADLDGNGRMDLLVSHSGWNALGRYMQGSGGMLAERLTTAPSDGFANQLAIGDINNDGCTDALFADHNYGLVTTLGRNCILPLRRARLADDFNGDGRSDLFWRNTGTGANAIWRSADFATPQSITHVTNTAWQVLGGGDFNGDGKADLLWKNDGNGQHAIWRSANSAISQSVTHVKDGNWRIAGIGDFDGDGRHDLLWRNAADGRNVVWYAGDYARQRQMVTLAGAAWHVAGIGDFDADGRDDILWHDAITRQGTIWPAGNFWKKRSIMKVTNPAWTIAAVGDFDGDRHADILWRDAVAGTNAIWRQGYYTLQQSVSALRGPEWKVVAAGDYDGDRKHDIAWRNEVTGENIVWLAASSGRLFDVTDVTNLQWQVQP